MDQYEIVAERRERLGKGGIRRLRRAGQVPGVIYGAGKDVVPLAMNANTLKRQLENESIFSHILTVKVDGDSTQAVIRELQRDPVSTEPVHLDFLRVSATNEITMHVPLHFANEDVCVGRKAGGVISHLTLEVEIACLPKDLPEAIEVDMAALEVGDSVHLSQLIMPEGVRLTTSVEDAEHDHPVASVAEPQKLDLGEEEALEGEAALVEGAEVEGEPGAEEAPAEPSEES